MPNEDLHAEIELLRKQLNAIQSERESAGTNAEPETDERVQEASETAALNELLSEVDIDKLDLTGQFRELLDSLDKDIKNTKPSTLLIVFALGVLIGRLR